MFRRILAFACLTLSFAVTAGCGDDIRTTRTITTHEEEPPRMVSPGTEIVE